MMEISNFKHLLQSGVVAQALIPALRMQRRADVCELKISLICTVSSKNYMYKNYQCIISCHQPDLIQALGKLQLKVLII